MSLAPYTFRPLTPPEVDDLASLVAAGRPSHHARSYSATVFPNNKDLSPESLKSTPVRSPIYRQSGPTLLPKIRTRDNVLQLPSQSQTTKIHKRAVSNASNRSTYNNVRPQVYRSATEPVQDCISLMSPISNMSHSRASSVAPFVPYSRGHSRAVSQCSVDEAYLRRHGYLTYGMPVYSQPVYYPSESMTYLDAPSITVDGAFDLGFDFDQPDDSSRHTSMTPPPPSTLAPSLLLQEPITFTASEDSFFPMATTDLVDYLTQPTQPINLVRQLTYSTGRGLSTFFWWDVRNVRSWTSFSLSTFDEIPDLSTLMHFQHPSSTVPHLEPHPTVAAIPTCEQDLASLIAKIYFPRINTAAQLSLGPNAPHFYLAPTTPLVQQDKSAANVAQATPSFLLNYPSENQYTLSGSPRGRVVGIAKSFDAFASSMRHDSPAQRVKYLKALSQLQKCMREHSCRYGFIITEIELVCVRAGADEFGNPYFGVLEVADAIATKTSADTIESPLTASLALYFLLMLAKKVPLPAQHGSFMDVGGLGALTRSRVLPANAILPGTGETETVDRKTDGRDSWMPEPQVGEKRDAKTARGWVWPSDPWHKREGGRRSRRG